MLIYFFDKKNWAIVEVPYSNLSQRKLLTKSLKLNALTLEPVIRMSHEKMTVGCLLFADLSSFRTFMSLLVLILGHRSIK